MAQPSPHLTERKFDRLVIYLRLEMSATGMQTSSLKYAGPEPRMQSKAVGIVATLNCICNIETQAASEGHHEGPESRGQT